MKLAQIINNANTSSISNVKRRPQNAASSKQVSALQILKPTVHLSTKQNTKKINRPTALRSNLLAKKA
jgi:hypothetical protein